jgi:hypothetical protein
MQIYMTFLLQRNITKENEIKYLYPHVEMMMNLKDHGPYSRSKLEILLVLYPE